MNPLNYFFNTEGDLLSEEVHSDGLSRYIDSIDTTPVPDMTSFDPSQFFDNINIAGFCESADVVDSINRCVEPSEFDVYLGSSPLPNDSPDISKNLLLYNSLPVHNSEKN